MRTYLRFDAHHLNILRRAGEVRNEEMENDKKRVAKNVQSAL